GRDALVVLVGRDMGCILFPQSPRLHDARQVAPAQQDVGQSVGLVLEHVALLDVPRLARPALYWIAHRLVQPLVELAEEEGAPLLASPPPARHLLEEVLRRPPPREQQQGGPLPEDAEGLD